MVALLRSIAREAADSTRQLSVPAGVADTETGDRRPTAECISSSTAAGTAEAAGKWVDPVTNIDVFQHSALAYKYNYFPWFFCLVRFQHSYKIKCVKKIDTN